MLVLPLLILMSQQPSKVTTQSIVDRYLQAIGGQPVLDGIRTVHLHREISYEGSHTYRVIADIYEDERGRFLIDSTDTRLQVREGYDGEHRWGHTVYNGHSQRYDLQNDITFLQDDRSGYRHRLISTLRASQLLGAAEVAGKKTVVLKFTSPRGMSSLYYFDVQSGLLVRTVHPVEFVQYGATGQLMRSANDGHYGFVDTCDYSEYRPLSGSDLLFAYRIDCASDFQKRTSRLKSAEVNEPVKEQLFEVPK